MPGNALTMAQRTIAAHRAETMCACLLLLLAANLLTTISHKGITADEFYHIPAGYYHLSAGNFQLNTEHPPLVKMFAAAPLLFARPHAPQPQSPPTVSPAKRTHDALAIFWRANTARFETISFWSRVPLIALTFALGALIFIYTRQLFNRRAALFATALFILEPTVLAHGRVIQTDMPAALAYLAFFFTLHAYSSAPTARRALVLGVVTGLALVTKFSMIILVPVLVITLFVLMWIGPRRDQRRGHLALQMCLVAFVILLMINGSYYFQSPPLSEGDLNYVSLHNPSTSGAIKTGLDALAKIIPTPFLFGIYQVAIHNRNGHLASLLGTYRYQGWWYYFPVAFALKTTLPFLLLSIASLSWALRRLIGGREKRFLVLILPVAIYTVFAMTSRINIGVRHFLPVFPFLFILGGAFLDQLLRLRSAQRTMVMTVTLLMCWMGVEAMRTYPHYMSYMNQLAWRHPRWYYLSDSNVEWGDDVRELALYLRARGETKVRAALLDGTTFNDYSLEYVRTLDHYGIEHINLISTPGAPPLPETRYVAIGASYLNGALLLAMPAPQRLAVIEYRRRAPEAVFGNSIYLYRVKE